ncbi:MAG: metallophosphoesterase family protein [Dissulfurispiraceae bacterium]
MKIIIHLSDLHFGKNKPALEIPLLDMIKSRRPDLIIVSGDITQRATIEQFEQARKFFSLLPRPIIAVPGNHDIPSFLKIRSRFSHPYKNYKKYISKINEPHYIDKELAVIGINSVRPSKLIEGRLNTQQLLQVQKKFSELPKKSVKIIVMHHPINLPLSYPGKILGRARKALDSFRETGVDLILSGHLHSTLYKYRNAVYRIPRQGPLIIHAGTAISSRMRTEPNSFNVIIVNHLHIRVERYEFKKTTFSIARTENFGKKSHGWIRVSA